MFDVCDVCDVASVWCVCVVCVYVDSGVCCGCGRVSRCAIRLVSEEAGVSGVCGREGEGVEGEEEGGGGESREGEEEGKWGRGCSISGVCGESEAHDTAI